MSDYRVTHDTMGKCGCSAAPRTARKPRAIFQNVYPGAGDDQKAAARVNGRLGRLPAEKAAAIEAAAQKGAERACSTVHMAAAEETGDRLWPAMRGLQASLERKAREFHDVIKIGRTHLQDAVPMRLGQEFSGYARQVEATRERIEAALPGIHELAWEVRRLERA